MVPAGLALLCLVAYLAFLVPIGEMFYHGSDIVANTAYGMTLFNEVHRAGWTVPKPAHMLLFGAVYWITGDLWFVHLALILATALTVWAGCLLLQRQDDGLAGCIAFCAFLTAVPRTFATTLSGGPGCVNVMFLFLAVLCLNPIDRKPREALSVLFLSLACLTRPDSWPCAYLIVFTVLARRFLGRMKIRLHRGDLLWLIPLAMPLVWVLVDWGVFGDPLYSVKIPRAFAVEAVLGRPLAEGPERNELADFLPQVKSALFDLFSLAGWLSMRTALVVGLCLAGTVAMARRNGRSLLLVGCLMGGTLLFYFVYALRGTLFRLDYVYTLLVSALLIASAGLGSLCRLARRVRPRRAARLLQAGLACGVLFFLLAGPYQEKIEKERIPILKRRALVARRADAAIDVLVKDIRKAGVQPVILTTKWIPGSRISMRLRTGRDVFLVERLVARQHLGGAEGLPELEGRVVYCCFLNRARRDVTEYLRGVIKRAERREIIYERQGLVVLKCIY